MMKEKINPTVMAVAIVVVVVVVAVVGFKIFGPEGHGNGADYRQKYLPAGAPVRTSPGEGVSTRPAGAPAGYMPRTQ